MDLFEMFAGVGPNIGAIVGGTVGGLVLLCIVAAVLVSVFVSSRNVPMLKSVHLFYGHSLNKHVNL